MIRKDYLQILEEIKKHNRAYFHKLRPEISDYEYDLLVKRAEKIEKEHPEWVPSDTPTRYVNEMPSQGFPRIRHTYPMLSLSNTYSKKEVADFVKRVEKGLENRNAEYCVELKMDGVAVSLRYDKGKLVYGVTRGNGWYGDDITCNIRKIKTIPHALNKQESIEVRGEIFIPKKEFVELNCEREECGNEVWANPRNAAAGSLKLLDSSLVAKRKMDIVVYTTTKKGLKTQSEMHYFLEKLGLPVCDSNHFKVCTTIEEIFAFVDRIEALRCALPFEIDGVVIKVNNLCDHELLGATAKSPRWATAYKFAPEQAESVIEDISVQVGRTGILTPVAELKPIFLAGSTISRATLHNEKEIERKDIRIGDFVIIEKGGDVIPKVVQVVKEKRPLYSYPWTMPCTCPICGAKLVRIMGEVAVRCPNKTLCKGQNLQRLIFFASKNAMNIENLGPEIVKKLVEHGYLFELSDIYQLNEEKLSQIEGFKEKSIRNLLITIERSKRTTLSRFIFSIGIPYVGRGTADLLAKSVKSIETLAQMSEEALCMIDGIGSTLAYAIVSFFNNLNTKKEIERLFVLGVRIVEDQQECIDHPFFGKTFVLTGSLETLKRSEAMYLIQQRGGRVSGSVSKRTDYVLFGRDTGSKYSRAKALGITMIDEKTFKKMV